METIIWVWAIPDHVLGLRYAAHLISMGEDEDHALDISALDRGLVM